MKKLTIKIPVPDVGGWIGTVAAKVEEKRELHEGNKVLEAEIKAKGREVLADQRALAKLAKEQEEAEKAAKEAAKAAEKAAKDAEKAGVPLPPPTTVVDTTATEVASA